MKKRNKKIIRVNFSPKLVPMVLSRKKFLTWRINDEKDIQVGDELVLWMKGRDNNGVQVEDSAEFGRGEVIEVWEKAFKDFTSKEKDGHEKFSSNEEMVEQYRKYYGPNVSKDTIVKIIRFKLIS